MKKRTFLVAALAASLTMSAFALSSEYRDWVNGPVQFLMTKEEVQQWNALKTDDEAKAFVALFWARRDPTPDTPGVNEFKNEFDARVRAADGSLASGESIRGALTDRGKVFILFGQPKKIQRAAKPQTPGFDNATGNLQSDQRDAADFFEWVYEGDDAKAMFNAPRAVIRFVDRMETKEYRLDRTTVDLKKAQERVVQAAIKQPNLTAAPAVQVAAPAAQAPVAPAAPVVVTELTTPELKTAVTDFKAAAKNPYDKKIYASTGEFVTPAGQTFVPVMLYLPKATGLDATHTLTFFGVVEDASGKSVLAFEEPAKLTESKGDYYVDKSLHLAAGKHRGIFGLAENGKPVAMVSADMDLTGTLDKDAAAISPLMLSNNIYPLSEAQAPEDPFAFGGVKVVPKADHAFRSSDELWYFFELRNPGIAEVPTDPNTVPVTGAPAAEPKVQVKIDVEGTSKEGKKVKMAAPPTEVAAIAMKGVPGHYGVGSAIPLETFKPGDYTFTVKVIDTVKKTSYTLSDKFTIVE